MRLKKGLLTVFLGLFCSMVFAQAPTAAFSVDPASLEACVGDEVTFTDESVTNGGPAIVSWTWSTGEGNTNVQNPVVIYTTEGTKTVTLTVKNQDGQSDSEQVVLTIHPLPDAEFSILSNDCEAPFEITFTNESESCANCTYEWNYGNGNTSTGFSAVNPQPYPTDGTYTATLTVTNSDTGCQKVYSDDIVVSEFLADISAPTEACVGDVVTFEDNSTAGANSWTWDSGGGTFQNGTTSSSQNIDLTFASAGDYTITLTADNTVSGCPSSIDDHIITVHPLPVVDFSADILSTCPGGEIITFTINPYVEGSTYEFDFGDGTPPVSTTGAGGEIVTHEYFEEGVFDVTITVTDENGCSTTLTKTNYITIEEPQVDFTADVTRGCADLTVNFTDLSSSIDPAGDPIVSWDWDFGDGNTSTDQNPTNTYSFGRYTVTLTVTTQNGCTATEIKTRYIRVGEGVSISLTRDPIEACIKEPIEFDASGTLYDGLAYDAVDGNGDPVYDEDDIEFEWTFGANDGGNNTASNGSSTLENIITHSFAQDTGWMTVTLKITFRGCETEAQFDDYVYIKPPKSQFILSQTNICNPGDGSFPITIDADARGNHPDIVPVNVDPASSWPDLSILGDANSDYTQFTDDIFVTWDWGDGATTTFSTDGTGADFSLNADFLGNSSASHDYATYGEYVVTQTIVNNTTGCDDETSQTVYITKVEADYTFSNDSVCLNNSLSFDAFDGTNLSTTVGPNNTALTYDWTFQDGSPTTSTAEEPTSQFFVAGDNKDVKVVIENAVGCKDSITKTVDVLALPIANATASPDVVCADPDNPGYIDFSNTSSSVSGVPLDPNLDVWNYGDGDSDGLGEHDYDTPNNDGPYTVTITVTDEFGCVGSGATQVEATWPIPDFVINTQVPDIVCNNSPVQITNSSSVATFNGGTATYTWSGDPTISSTDTENTFVTYNHPTPDADLMEENILTLTVTDKNGCTDEITKPITVSLPQAIILSDSVRLGTSVGGIEGGCPPERWDFDGRTSLSISDSTGNAWNYNWRYLNASSTDTTVQNSSNLPVSGDTFFPGKYLIEFSFTDAYGCSDVVVKEINVIGPSAAVAYAQSVDSCGQYVTFTVLEDDPDFPIISLELFFGDGNSITGEIDPSCGCFEYTYIYKGAGTFEPYVETFGGSGDCPVPYPFDPVQIDSTGVFAALEADRNEAFLGENIVFTDLSTSANPLIEWMWEFLFEDTIVNPTGGDVAYAFSTEGEHDVVLTVLNDRGCRDNDTITVVIDDDILIPNVFTPNGDGSNDRFYIPGSPFDQFELLIFNRWGKKMYDYKGSGQPSWNGRNKGDGKLCNDGTYYYIVKGTLLSGTFVERNGHVTLVGGKP